MISSIRLTFLGVLLFACAPSNTEKESNTAAEARAVTFVYAPALNRPHRESMRRSEEFSIPGSPLRNLEEWLMDWDVVVQQETNLFRRTMKLVGLKIDVNGAPALRGDVKANAVMPIAGSRMTALMGEEINALMQRDFPARAVAPVVALLAHDDAPCNGEMFSVGGGGFARVMVAVAAGYRGTDKDWTIEDAASHFSEAMDVSRYTVPADALVDAELYQSDVPWDAFRAFIA